MKELEKKQELEDMLVTHKPDEQVKNKAQREKEENLKMDAKNHVKLERMKEKLFSTTDSKKRERILNMIQRLYGNEAAERIIKELRFMKDETGILPTENNNSSKKETKG